jgi:RNA polymerase sigma-70 factor (ECF subfamily)
VRASADDGCSPQLVAAEAEWTRRSTTDQEALKNTEPSTLARIYEAYHRKVVAYTAKLLGSDLAEDVAQEVFVKVGRSLDTLSDDTKLTSWIYAITINTVRDHARKHGAEAGRLVPAREKHGADDAADDPLAQLPNTTSRGPEQSAIRNEMVACYLDYVRRLPRRYYVVYALSELEDLSNQEIADRLSLSLGTVKIRLHRARALLHGELRRNCRCYRNERGELMGEPAEKPHTGR